MAPYKMTFRFDMYSLAKEALSVNDETMMWSIGFSVGGGRLIPTWLWLEESWEFRALSVHFALRWSPGLSTNRLCHVFCCSPGMETWEEAEEIKKHTLLLIPILGIEFRVSYMLGRQAPYRWAVSPVLSLTFWDRVWLSGPDCPATHLAQTGFEFGILLPQPPV